MTMTKPDTAETLQILIDDLHAIVFTLNKIRHEVIQGEHRNNE